MYRSRLLLALSALPILAVGACCTSVASLPPGPPEPESMMPRPEGKRAPRSDEGIEVPESGFWTRNEPGFWTYDLGVGLVPDVQLVARNGGRGLMRVALPAGANGAILTALTVMYVKNASDQAEPAGAASGQAVWHVHADANGAPGEELSALVVTVDDATAAPLDGANEGTKHDLPAPLEVPATFWLVFEVPTGDPRIGAMRLIGDFAQTYQDLYYVEAPGAALGAPKNLRPYLRLDFNDLGR